MDGTDLLGRDEEQATLNALLDPARPGPATLAVVADAGHGTSALLTAAADTARQRGFRVLRTAGQHDERDLDGLAAQRLLTALRPDIRELPGPARELALDALNLRLPDPGELTDA